MHTRIDKPMECSQCGSRSHEYFHNDFQKGVRCLHCGHERLELPPKTDSEPAVWRREPDRVEKF